MKRNMGTTDRGIRAVVGIGAAVTALLTGAGSAFGIVLWVVSVIMLVTAAAGYCPVYTALRVSSVGGLHRETTRV
ncbi:DUF2892 domain-containing protein [Blastococcus sp. MG754426]|uniref:YgaP family membrane protein n=1 Tax=unclassified Blastococcus TaxID=2619396 RepID=UPI001EF0A310|nr:MULTISPECIES: DUF2892 domain-containing protein [unclassified Blastococcus]MCF6506938.1 DUF2892 domain-containing protein [Blastococcus sp. MG754426]MCF6511816.1 DUF2892 domain-containing protein [Blastococcus sp. MG754427]MCF6735970.1 DUF2892 domain-containing protein [Blastococcus sp. KM273129]